MGLFIQQGYHGLSIREIAAAVGVSKAALYYHFRDKEQLFLAILQANLDQVAALIDQAVAGAEHTGDQIRAVATAILQQPVEQRAVIRLAKSRTGAAEHSRPPGVPTAVPGEVHRPFAGGAGGRDRTRRTAPDGRRYRNLDAVGDDVPVLLSRASDRNARRRPGAGGHAPNLPVRCAGRALGRASANQSSEGPGSGGPGFFYWRRKFFLADRLNRAPAGGGQPAVSAGRPPETQITQPDTYSFDKT